MKLLITSATEVEVVPLRSHLDTHFQKLPEGGYRKGQCEVWLVLTGVGMMATAWQLGRLLAAHRFDLAIQAGIGGAFDREVPLGTVFNVVSEQLGDLGVEHADGSFSSVFELGLMDPNAFPFQQGRLVNSEAGYEFLPRAKGLTVNTVHGSAEGIRRVQAHFDADVESMEGAAFFFACLLADQPFLEIRSISNYVEPRRRDAWDIPRAVDRLNQTLVQMLDTLLNIG